MASKKVHAVIHAVDHFAAYVAKSKCGVYADSLWVTAYPKYVTCKRCKKSRKR